MTIKFDVVAKTDFEAAKRAREVGGFRAPPKMRLVSVHAVVDDSDETLWHVEAHYERSA